MTLGRYVAGLVALALIVAPAVLGARRARTRLVPDWSGAPASLVDALLAITSTLGVSLVLGAVGLFRVVPVVVGCVAAGALMHRWGQAPAAMSDDRARPCRDPLTLVSIVACCGIAGQWLTRTAAALDQGITNPDSLKYHLSFAARFHETGWLTRLHFLGPEFPDTFHPANNEVLHALGMLAFDRDVISPVLNLGWVVLALLAAWCLGRPFGAAPLSMLAAGVVLASPLLNVQNAGSGSNDIAAIFFLVAAAALLVQPRAEPQGWSPAVALAGLAAGLGLATKLTLGGAVAALTIAVIVAAPRGARVRTAIVWTVPLTVAGSYWFVRNLLTTGTPAPSIDLSALGFSNPHFRTVDELGFSVADYLTDRSVVEDWFLPNLVLDFGRGWAFTFGLAAVGALATTFGRGRDAILRGLGVTAMVATAVYATTPTTALGPPGKPLLFGSNVAYLTPALVLGLVLLPTAPWLRHDRARVGLTTALVAALAMTWAGEGFISAWPDDHRALGVVAGIGLAVALVAVVATAAHRRAPRTQVVAVGVLVAVAVAALGWPVARGYLRDRYDAPRWAWAQDLRHERIALAGHGPQYPLYGRALDNHVQYVGESEDDGEFHDITTCEAWRTALRDGRFDIVVLRSERTRVEDRELPWTQTDPAATPLVSVARTYVFELDPSVPDDGSCPG